MRHDPGAERGSVVAEFALAMPAVMLVLGVLLAGVQLGSLQVRATDAAADAARGWARGDPASTVGARLAVQLPGAQAARSAQGDLVCATVTAPAPVVLGRWGLSATARACAVAGGR